MQSSARQTPQARCAATAELAAGWRTFLHSIQWATANKAAMDTIVYASPANRSTPADAWGEAAASAAWPHALKNEPAAKTARLLRPRL